MVPSSARSQKRLAIVERSGDMQHRSTIRPEIPSSPIVNNGVFLASAGRIKLPARLLHPARRNYRPMSTDSTYDNDDNGSLPNDDDVVNARVSAERRVAGSPPPPPRGDDGHEELQNRIQELNQANSDLTNFFGSTQIPVVMLGRDLRLRRFTPAAEKIFNLHQADIGRPLADIRFSVDMPNLEALAHEAQGTMQAREQEVRDREGRWHLLRIRPCTADDKIEGSVVSLLDIDDIKRREQRTREAADYAEAIVGTVREPLLVLDGDLRVQSASASFYLTFKVKAEDIANRLLYELEDGRWNIPGLRSLLEEILPQHETVEDYEVEHDFPGIGTRTMLLNARTLRQKEGKAQLILLAIEDVTERQRAAQALKDADRRKDEFLAMLAHELRNPLAAVSSAIELLGAGGGAEHLEMGRKIIGRQTAQLVRLVDDLLDVSRISRGVVSLRNEVLDAATVVRRAAETVSPLMERRRHDLKLSVGKKPLWLEGDATRLEQLVANLLTNSAKYTEPGGRVELTATRDGDAIKIAVRDNGIGISAKQLPEVFELFSQSDRSADRAAGGLGIGLTLVRSIAQLHGGSVVAKSDGLGQGSKFTVRLPALAEDARRESASRRSAPSLDAFPARCILIVDDNEDAALALSGVLEAYGHTVHQAHDGPSSLESAALHKPQAILLDIGLPGLDGYEVAKRLRQDPDLSHVLLIAISGYCQEEDRQRSREAGFDHHLAKPTDHRELLALLSETRGAATEVS